MPPGPRRQPTALRLLRGDPGKRGASTREPTHAGLDVTVPELLRRDPVAAAEWERVTPGLVACGQVTVMDRAALLGYCLKFAQWQALELEAARHPAIIRGKHGNPMANPAIGLANKALHMMLKAAAELGMTPAGRSRVSVEPSLAPGAVAASGRWAQFLK